ncbi:hypothetical protein E2C01_070168 [Portunus trituberculatus]|uniref:Uncharacterized protein n=1 Tax=Portunus trituberculatus TaxID=210409 RepID=A0A5B7I0K8_PORTR|nr:hypothetical protein [Portunus trituberculatus]
MGELTTSSFPQWTYTHIRDRRAQTLLARLRIGHTYLTNKFLLSRDPQPYCDNCLVPLTVRYLLVECPSLTDLRHRYLYLCRSRDSGVYYISKVLGPECLAQDHDVFRFFGEKLAFSQSNWASCDEDGLSMETSDDIVTAVPLGPAVSKSAVQPDPRPPRTGRSNDGSHHSPVGRKAAVQRPSTSQFPVSHGQTLEKAPCGENSVFYCRSSLQPV